MSVKHIVLASAALMLAGTASANLITNGDFQTGTASGWSALNGAAVVADSGPNGAGDYSLRVTGVDWSGVTAANNGAFMGENGKTYTISFDIKVDASLANDTDIYMQKAWGGNYPAYNVMANEASLADGLWHHVTWDLTTTDGGFNLGLWNNGNASRDFSIDNVYADVVPEPAALGLLGTASLLAFRRRRA